MWEFFDRIVVITTKNSDRVDGVKNEMRMVGIKKYNILKFSPVTHTVNDGGNGVSCWDLMKATVCDETCQSIAKNHFYVIEDAYQRGCSNVLIFEDDISFTKPFNYNRMNKAVKWMKTNNWDIFFLGYIQWKKPFMIPYSSNVVKLFSPYLGHAYIVNFSGMKKMLSKKDTGMHIDRFMSKLDARKFGIYPMIAFQSVEPAIYRKVQRELHLPKIKFNTLCRISESWMYYSVVIIIVAMVVKKYYN